MDAQGSPSSSRALGDVVHAAPVLTALRIRFPAARITWVINSAYESLIRNHPDLTTRSPSIAARSARACSAPRYALSFAGELRVATSTSSLISRVFLTGLMCLATRAAGHRLRSAREGSRAYTRRIHVPDAERIHAVDRYWRVAEAPALTMCRSLSRPLDPAESPRPDEMTKLPRPWIAVAVGAKWTTKRPRPLRRTPQPRWVRGGTCFFVGAAEDAAARRDRPAQRPAATSPARPRSRSPPYSRSLM